MGVANVNLSSLIQLATDIHSLDWGIIAKTITALSMLNGQPLSLYTADITWDPEMIFYMEYGEDHSPTNRECEHTADNST